MSTQTEESCSSFEWQWTERPVFDSEVTFYRKLFESRGLWYDHCDGKIVADAGSGNGRMTYALARLTKAKRIISIELSPRSMAKQKSYIKDPRVEFVQGDIAVVKFEADIIYCNGVIQHTRDPQATLANLIANLRPDGELLVSFYQRTFATQALEPLRFVLSRLPKRVLWALTPLLAPLFMVRKEGRESGFRNAMHTAYDWFGSHAYQYYFTTPQVIRSLMAAGIHPKNIIQPGAKGLYRVRKGPFPHVLNEELTEF
jgi:SAM-dependent methyltransferase